MIEINEKYKALVPEMPKVLSKEQIFVYVPNSAYTNVEGVGKNSFVSRGGNNIINGEFSAIIGRNNNVNSCGLCSGFNNLVNVDESGYVDKFNSIHGKNNDIKRVRNTFIFGEGNIFEDDEQSVYFTHDLHLNTNGEPGSYGNFIAGRFKTPDTGTGKGKYFELDEVRLGTFLGPYHHGKNSYADVLLGATHHIENSRHNAVLGYGCQVTNSERNFIAGSENKLSGDYADRSSSKFNGIIGGGIVSKNNLYCYIFGNASNVDSCQSTLVGGEYNAVKGITRSFIFGNNNVISEDTGSRASKNSIIFGDGLRTRDVKYSLIFGEGLKSHDNEFSGVNYSAVFGQGHLINAPSLNPSGHTAYHTLESSIVTGRYHEIVNLDDSLVFGIRNYIKTHTTDSSIGAFGSIIGGGNNSVVAPQYSAINAYAGTFNTIIHSGVFGADFIVNNLNRSFVSGNSHTVTNVFGSHISGRYNIVGHDTEVLSNGYSVEGCDVSGLNNVLYRTIACSVGGKSNNVSVSEYSNVSGAANIVRTTYRSIVFGNGNNVSNVVKGSLIGGYSNTVSACEHNVLSGMSNTVQSAYYSYVNGKSNTINGTDNSLIVGNNIDAGNITNSVVIATETTDKISYFRNCHYSLMIGAGFQADGVQRGLMIGTKLIANSNTKEAAIIGQSCNVNAMRSLTMGYGLFNNCDYQLVAGKFNISRTNTTDTRYLFCLGDGTSASARKDALLFYATNGANGTEYHLKLGNLTISESKMKKIMDFIETIT